jgi:phage baseplate assembly protein W
MQPTFGSKLLELCFEQQNDELPENIEKEVRRAVSEWLDYINIQNVETLTEEGDLNQIYVKIDYSTTLNPNTINQITIDASTGGY